MSQSKKVIIAYGFEYDALIGSPDNLILCKCIENGHPFYASPYYIENIDFKSVNEQLDQITESTDVNSVFECVNKLDEIKKKIFDVSKDDLDKSFKQVNTYAKRRYLADFISCKPCWRTVLYYDNIKFNHLDINYESEGDENGYGR